jgi:acetylglutamate kinase
MVTDIQGVAPATQRMRALIKRLAIALARQAAAEDDAAERQKAKINACCAVRPLQ